MKHWFTKVVLFVGVLAICNTYTDGFLTSLGFSEKTAQAGSNDLKKIDEAIETLHLAKAKQLLANLDADLIDTPSAQFLLGKLYFFEGDYSGAMANLRQAIEQAKTQLSWKELRDAVAEASEVTRNYQTQMGPSKRFVYQYQTGIDHLLISYADHALARQFDALSTLLGQPPHTKIQIIFCPSILSFSKLSGLTVEQIETTGTVGVSKYGKIMVLSPRIIDTGYPWLDTLAHELTHIFISRLSSDRAPIWLHEGIAKLFEKQWQTTAMSDLTPAEAYILDRAAHERRLIPLRRFHPSVAHLPNQEDAALAYAQVLSFMRYINTKMTDAAWIKQLLELMAKGNSLDHSINSIGKVSIKRLYSWWVQAITGQRLTPVPAVGLMKRLYKKGRATEQSQLKSAMGTDVRRHIRLGDLLRLRGHQQAAAVEYKKALALSDSPTTEISDRLAGVYLSLGQHSEIVTLLTPMTRLYPHHVTIFVQLGQAYFALNRFEKALIALNQVDALNPFHPDVNCLQSRIYQAKYDIAAADRETEHCNAILNDLKKHHTNVK